MTIAAAREKAHNIINQSSDEKVFEILSILEPTSGEYASIYDEDMRNILRERSEEYQSGKSKTITLGM